MKCCSIIFITIHILLLLLLFILNALSLLVFNTLSEFILLVLSPRIVLLNRLSLSIIILLLTFALIGQQLLFSEPWPTLRTCQNS